MHKRIFLIFLLGCNLCYAKAKIYDCFMFFNELEIINIRFEELYDVVDHFVIVESAFTHSGEPKPLFFADNRHHFSKFQDKIIYILVDRFPSFAKDPQKNAWQREYYQRNQIEKGLKGCSPNDIIIISDVDEIPRRSTIVNLPPLDNKVFNLDEQFFRYQLNRIDPREDPAKTHGARVLRYSRLKQLGPQKVRTYNDVVRIPNAAWHFNSMGGLDSILYKHRSFTHFYDIDPAFFKRSKELWDNVILKQHPAIPVDSSFPKYVVEHQDWFIKIGMIAPVDPDWEEQVENVRNNIRWGFGMIDFPVEWEALPIDSH